MTKIGQHEFFLLNIIKHVIWWVVSWFHNLFFMNEILLNVFSSSPHPNTWTIAIFCQFHVAIELFIQNGKKIFFHNLEIRFRLKCLAIILFALCDITNLKNEDYISNNQERGTIIPFVILGATQNVNLIRFKCKRNELFLLQ